MTSPIRWGSWPPGGRGALPLLLYVLLRGLDATVLKGLQEFGAHHPVRGMDPISFCNLFFLAQLAVGAGGPAARASHPGGRSGCPGPVGSAPAGR